MTASISPLAFDDVRDALSRAIESTKGVRLTFESPEDCATFRRRCNAFRARERKESLNVYPVGDPMHGNCIYDKLIFSIRKEEPTKLYLEKIMPDRYLIEEL